MTDQPMKYQTGAIKLEAKHALVCIDKVIERGKKGIGYVRTSRQEAR